MKGWLKLSEPILIPKKVIVYIKKKKNHCETNTFLVSLKIKIEIEITLVNNNLCKHSNNYGLIENNVLIICFDIYSP